jgi:outer membrane protein assembly factor BamB
LGLDKLAFGRKDRRSRTETMRNSIVNLWNNHRIATLAGVAVAIAAVAVASYLILKRPEDISNPNAAFTEEPESNPIVGVANWPLYGLNQERTRYLNAPEVVPPFKIKWRFKGNKLLEYSPVLAGGSLYAVNNNGRAFAIKTRNGKARWKREIATLNASAPAYSDHVLYISNLEPGQVQARGAASGTRLWLRRLPGRTESSPAVVGNKVIAGCECGTLYAFDKTTGKTLWETELGGEIKAAPAVSDGIVYIGTYGGDMNAVNAKDGSIKWSTGSQGASFGRAGRFYATAAIGFGRVYAGSLDGRMYSFEKETGELAWSQSTGGYVYAGAVVADTAATQPSVYFGSYDGTFYALDAKTGEERWSADPGGSISGAASLIGETVYVGDLTTTRTHGYNASNGKEIFTFRDGAYNPVISDGKRLYLTGYKTIYSLKPAQGKAVDGVIEHQGKTKKKQKAATTKKK